MRRTIRIMFFLIKLCLGYTVGFCIKLLFPKYRNLWIISERGNDARDNGFFLFQYVRREHPDINIVYVISEKSPDLSRVISEGKWVAYNSFKHFIYYAMSKVRISTHSWGGDLPYGDYFKKEKYLRDSRKITIFLQHGVIKDDLPTLYAEQNPVDMFVCGARPEYDFVNSVFHYAPGVVQYTGLARFDNLHHNKLKNQILIMPTFRRWLSGEPINAVLESTYVQKWNAILNNQNLIEKLEENDIQMIFYPHYLMQAYIDLFQSSSSKVIIGHFSDFDVQTFLKESKLLITDFSSVFFDFSYMNKPVVYYHFDTEDYITKHYDFTKGYFSYEDDGFGKVTTSENELVYEILECIQNRFAVDEKYVVRANRFFELRDQKNCQRIYNRIIRIIGEKYVKSR